MKKILFLTGSRGEWGYIRPILRRIEQRTDIEYRLIVTNMHLLPSFGSSFKEIEKDGFVIHNKIHMALDGYSHYTMAKSLGILLLSLPDIIETEKPDWIILAGDRGEQLMAAIACGYTYTPCAHIQAGELSGNIDGMTRHAIGKLVHLHFAANEDAAARLVNLGEEKFRVFNVGAPQLDELVESRYTAMKDLEKKYSIELSSGFILSVIHPSTEECNCARNQAETMIKALNAFDIPKVFILPNNDAGSDEVRFAIDNCRIGNYYVYANLKREDYLGFLNNCKCIVGNSSSGIIEAPTFKKASVNIGRRQCMRFRGINVIDVDFDLNSIASAIEKAISNEFCKALEEKCFNPYGDGHSSERILDILVNTNVNEKLLNKRLTY